MRLKPELDHSILAPVYEAIRQVKASLAPNVALLGFCGAPWTVASYGLGHCSGIVVQFAQDDVESATMLNRSSRLQTNAAAARYFKLGNIIFHMLSS